VHVGWPPALMFVLIFMVPLGSFTRTGVYP
jgi:hypothetical protein